MVDEAKQTTYVKNTADLDSLGMESSPSKVTMPTAPEETDGASASSGEGGSQEVDEDSKDQVDEGRESPKDLPPV